MRRAAVWMPVAAGLAGLTAILALAAWFILPRWQPALVVRHSPFAEQVFATDQRISGDDPSWPVLDRLHLGLPGADSAAARMAGSPDPSVRMYALAVLGTQPASPQVHDAAVRALSAIDPRERRRGLRILPVNASTQADGDLVRALVTDPAAMVRAESVIWLGRRGDPADIERMAGLLDDTDRSVAAKAAGALASMRSVDAAPRLLRAIRDHGRRELLVPALDAPVMAAPGFVLADWLPAIVDALRDDALRWNAQGAWQMLVGSIREPGVAQALVAALGSNDRQQRHLAAQPLWMSGYDAVPDLVRVGVEALSDDLLPSDGYTRTGGDNTLLAFRWLRSADPARTDPSLVRLLDADDAQARFLAAVVLGVHRADTHAAAICRVLIPHLADNAIGQDAVYAVRALYLLGPAAEPHLRAALAGADAQATALIRQIIRDWTDPPKHEIEAARRASRLTRISVIMHDAAIGDRLDAFTIPRIGR